MARKDFVHITLLARELKLYSLLNNSEVLNITKVYGPKKDAVTDKLKILNKEELGDIYRSTRRLRWDAHVLRMRWKDSIQIDTRSEDGGLINTAQIRIQRKALTSA
jgi:hypothetical protein